VRFIEYMDVGGATRWQFGNVVAKTEILQRITQEFGEAQTLDGRGSAPANTYRLADGTTFGIIASTTAPFCDACDRTRLTADGVLYNCLYAPTGTDVRRVVRGTKDPTALAALIRRTWQQRKDAGAQKRHTSDGRGPAYGLVQLRQDPHLEMHTRGG